MWGDEQKVEKKIDILQDIFGYQARGSDPTVRFQLLSCLNTRQTAGTQTNLRYHSSRMRHLNTLNSYAKIQRENHDQGECGALNFP